MINSEQPVESRTDNDQSLKTLSRAIAFSEGQFSLILVRCNYDSLRDRIVQKLKKEAQLEIRELFLPQSVNTLYTTIQAYLGQEQLKALMVFGLESVNDLDRLLASTNQVREEFRKNFPFLLVLWVNDKVLKSLIRLAPDFESWATTTEFSMPTEELIESLQKSAERVFSAVLEAGASQFLPNSVILSPSYRLELTSALRDLHSRGVQLDPPLKASLKFVLGRDDYASDKIDNALKLYQQSLEFWQQRAADTRLAEKGDLAKINDDLIESYFNKSLEINTSEELLIKHAPVKIQDSTISYPQTSDPSPLIWEVPKPSPYLEQQGLLLFHIGLCYMRLGQLQRANQQENWEEARHCFERCVDAFQVSGHPELVAKFISKLGEILQQLQEWTSLSAVAKRSRKLHKIYGVPHQLAQDYGFLAEVALQQSKWKSARKWAEGAIATLAEAGISAPQHQGLYLLLLARSLAPLGQVDEAVEHLETARIESDPQYDPQLYLRILDGLRSLYFERGHYLEAFRIKQEYGAIEAQFGLRAFVGAGRLQPQRQTLNPAITSAPHPASVALEIVTSGRENDVKRLIARLGRNDYKLTVIHGQSGVGKSSILTAGLVPALKQQAIGDRDALPILLQVYTDWVGTLEKLLTEALVERGSPESGLAAVESVPQPSQPDPQPLLARLRKNSDRNLLTVLIFDQFEEFFFVCTDPARRRPFYDFLRECLNIPFVKVILSLREDYLHYLLECDRLGNLDAVNNDILQKEVRYYLGNLQPEEAKTVIKSLTERSQFYLEEALIDELARDLANELGEVRPIELQVVGTQLQAEKITTLEQYNKSGRKERLVKNFLEETIADCGPQNERAARLVLYFLTDENGIRPLRTRAELVAEISAELVASKNTNLDLILEILVRSGLVVLLPEVPANRYQLVHDYLVALIRQQEDIKKEMKELRRVNEELKEENKLLAQLKESENQQKKIKTRLNRILIGVLIGALAGLLGVAALALQAQFQREKAENAAKQAETEKQRAAIAEIEAQNLSSKAFLLSNNELGSLVASIKAGTKFNKLKPINTVLPTPLQLEKETVNRLQQAVYTVTERNRLEAHTNSVVGVSFSPDGETLATASADTTVKLWNKHGTWLKNLTGHKDGVTSVSFSPDGETLATASADKSVKLWNKEGTEIATLTGHTQPVIRVTFSSDRELIATASADKTIKIWKRDARSANQFILLQTLTGHSNWVMDVSFSPDSKTLASVSLDKTVKLWKWDKQRFKARPYKTLTDHRLPVLGVSFSPDGQTIATASEDRTVKLWNQNGKRIRTLTGHTAAVRGVSFSPDGQMIATASSDKTVMLWRSDGTKIRTLVGHHDQVFGVSFSPDGKTLASASRDNTVKLWHRFSRDFPRLQGHSKGVQAVSFSPAGDRIATASEDGTAKLFSSDGKELATLKGHSKFVTSVSFSPTDDAIATASKDNTVKLWKRDGSLIATLTGHTLPINEVTFSPSGELLATASEDKTVKLWKRNGSLIATLTGHTEPVNSVSFSPDGELLATASEDNSVKIWQSNASNWKRAVNIQTLKGHQKQVFSVSFSPDGQAIATASADNTVKLWSRNGEFLHILEGHIGRVNSASFSPDGKIIASGSDDNTVKLWSRDGELLTTFEGHKGDVFSVSFSPDGKRLASASDDTTVRLWNLALDDLLVSGCDWVGDYLKTIHPDLSASDRSLCDRDGSGRERGTIGF